MATLLALFSSVSWGTADFLGGQMSRRYPSMFVVGVSQAFGLVVMLVVATASASWGVPTGYVPWAIVASLSGFTGLAVFYEAMATGAVGVVSPITALGGLGPLILGLLSGEQPTSVQYAGLIVALIGVVLASGPEISGKSGPRPVLLAVIATMLFGTCLAAIALGAQTSVVMTMTAMRICTVAIMAVLGAGAYLLGRRVDVRRRTEWLALAVIGVLDVAANLLFGVASRTGMLSLVAVLGSLYPVVTVLLAWWLIGERLRPIQYLGVTLAMIGVAAIMV